MNLEDKLPIQPLADEALLTQPSSYTLVKRLLIITAVSLGLVSFLYWVRGSMSGGNLVIGGGTLLVLLVSAALLHRNHVSTAAHLYTAAFWLSITAHLTTAGIGQTPGPGAYIILILAAAILLRGRVALFYSLLSFLAAFLIVLGTEMGRLPINSFGPDFVATISNNYPKALLMLSLLSLAFFALRHTLATLRYNENDLQQIRQTLGQRTADLSIINAQLRHEIEEREHTEAALEQQRSFLRQIIDTLPQYVFVKDENGRFVIVNEAIAKLYKSTPEELEGHSGRDFNPHKDELDELSLQDQAVLASQKEMIWPEQPFTDLDENKRWLKIVKRPLSPQNEAKYVLGVASDITVVKATTEALREKEEQFRTLVEASFDGLIICENHVIKDANFNYATMFGYSSADEVIGKNAASFLLPESLTRLEKMMLEDRKVSMEAIGIRQDKSTFPLEVISRQINYQGKVAQISGYRDISTRKQAEEAEQHAKKLESLSIMAGGLAHDFNNLLVAMMGQISLAKAKMEPSHSSHENLDKATQATETAALLTRQLLAYTGQGHFQVEALHLNNLISQNLQLFQDALPQNITFHTSLHPTLPQIQADGAQIQQIIMNLLLNAAEAIGTQPGKITIATAPHQLVPENLARWQQANKDVTLGDFVLLEIADTGQGMSEATKNSLFDPFYSTKGTGRGLGLAAVLGIIRGHNGGVRVESATGQGTLFQFLLPIGETDPPEMETAESSSEATPKSVLVIDDEKQVRDAISDILDLEAINSITAANGQEGVTLFAEHQTNIGLIILDLSMPGMSGIDTFTALREIDTTAKIILSSGFTESEILQKMAGTRPTGFLQKPYRLETVLQIANKYLQKSKKDSES